MSTKTPNFNYNSRSFLEIRDQLISYVRQYYPDSFQDFTENDLGILFIELIAGGSDILSYQIDRAFQETQLEFAQQRKSILSLAKNMGLNIPGKRGSITVVDFSVRVPAKGDSFSPDYLPVIKAGTQVTGGGKVFEVVEDIDFSSPLSNLGYSNRIIIPNIDANQVVQNYTLTKREVVYNGASKTYNKVVNVNDYKPFMNIILPDSDVISVENIIVLPGINNSTPTIDQFFNPQYRYYEVDYLIQDRIFINDTTVNDDSSLKAGKWQKISKKFIKEYTDKGFCKITFGGGNGDADLFGDAMQKGGVTNGLDNYIENTSLGEIPPVNNQIFIRYRVGGGSSSNLGANVLTSTGNVNMTVNGPEDQINQQVIRSLKVNNPIPALGGADQPSTEQIRNMIAYNFSAQNRCITLNDYIIQTQKMPGKYGIPFRLNAYKKNNKVVIPIIGLAADGKLDNTSTDLLKQNIAEYLSQYRALNDYVEIADGQIFNLAFDIELYIDENVPSNQISFNTINTVINEFDVNKEQMNTNYYLGTLYEAINNVTGVINIISVKVYNKVSNGYSINQMTMPLKSTETRELDLTNNTIYSEYDSMFEIKYPQRDIRLFLKKKSQLR